MDGWYYHLANMKRFLEKTDERLRRRIRCIWKVWKKPKIRVENLVKCGIEEHQAYMWDNTLIGYWRIAGSPIQHRAIINPNLKKSGFLA